MQKILKQITDEEILSEIGRFIVDMLVQRIRGEGKGVASEGGNRTDLAALSPDYIKQRARDSRLHPSTSPSTSNLTRTGEMLNSLRYRVNKGRVEIYVVGGAKVLRKVTYTNESRPWANLGRAEQTQILKQIEKLIGQKL